MSEGKILIVDDNESNSEITAMYIESEFDNETIWAPLLWTVLKLYKKTPK